MTVREWFRLQRRALWEHERGTLPVDLHELTEKVIAGQPVDQVESLGGLKLIFANAAEWERSRQLVERIRQQLAQAMAEIDRERARQVQVAWLAKDLLA